MFSAGLTKDNEAKLEFEAVTAYLLATCSCVCEGSY